MDAPKTDSRFPPHPRKPYYWPDGTGGAGGGLERRLVTRLRVPAIAADGTASGTIRLEKTAGMMLLNIKSTIPQWFRLYARSTDRTVDRNRGIDATPATPIILDCLFHQALPGAEVYTPLSRAGWVAGPGCTESARFPDSIDGSDVTRWTTHALQANGQRFSVDFGSSITFGSLKLDCKGTPKDFPTTFSVETSDDGTVWTMRSAAVSGQNVTHIIYATPIAARYVRFTITTAKSGFYWSIFEFNVYNPFVDYMNLRLWDGDVEGVQAFNWDDPAKEQLYYSLDVTDAIPSRVGILFWAGNFWTEPICISAWFPVPTNDPGTFDPPICNWENADILNMEQPWLGAEYVEPGDYRPRYYKNFNQLRPNGSSQHIARFPTSPVMPSVVGFEMNLVRGNLDTSAFLVHFCAYLNSGGPLGVWDTKPMLRMGLDRASVSTVTPVIYWRNIAGADNLLASGTPVSLALSGTINISGTVAPDGTDIRVKLKVNGTQVATAVVPTELTGLIGHGKTGILLDATEPPEGPLAFGGLAIKNMAVYGGESGVAIDIGYVPIEIPGGTLVKP